MIQSFGSKATEDLYHGRLSKESRKIPQNLWTVAFRKLDMLNTAMQLLDLKSPPANRLERLKGKSMGKYSIRINKQYRIVFEFRDNHAYEVEITDYH